MYRHAPFRLLVLGLIFVLAFAACSDDPTTPTQNFLLEVTLEGQGSVTLTTSDAAVPARLYKDSFAGNLSAGTQVTLTANPDDGFQFGAWSGDCEAEDPTCTFTLDASKQITLTFQAATDPSDDVTLTVDKGGNGAGTVTSTPGGIDCGAVCRASYAEGAAVTLTAVAAEGSSFAGWQGECATENSTTCTLNVTADQTLTALFTLKNDEQPQPSETFSITVDRGGDGAGTVTSTPAGIDCGATCQTSFEEGTAVTLTATSASGSSFTGWQGACLADTSHVSILNAPAGQTCTATYAATATPNYDVAVTLTGEGQVTTADATLSCPDLCTATYAENTQVTLTATPASGYAFNRWEGACQSAEPSCTVEVSSDRQVTAVFEVVTSPTATVNKGLARGSDDAEEYLRAGCHIKFPDDCVVANEVEIASRRSADDIDFGRDKIYGVDVLVGLRFTDLDIPQGAVITEARIQFQIDHGGSKPTSVTFYTQADARAPTFVEEVGNISSRSRNSAAVPWQIGNWPDDEGKRDDPNALTPNLAAVVQEVVNLPEWQEGDNALVFLFSGEGQRQATSFEDGNNNAGQNTRLTVTYQMP